MQLLPLSKIEKIYEEQEREEDEEKETLAYVLMTLAVTASPVPQQIEGPSELRKTCNASSPSAVNTTNESPHHRPVMLTMVFSCLVFDGP